MKNPVVLFLAGALFGSAVSSRALPPSQHTLSGEITTVDQNANTFTVRSPAGRPFSFVWNDSSRLRRNGDRCCSCILRAGLPVKVIYRTEIGRNVIRSANVHTERQSDECS